MVVRIADVRDAWQHFALRPRYRRVDELIQAVVRQLPLFAVPALGEHVAVVIVGIRKAVFGQEAIILDVAVGGDDAIVVLFDVVAYRVVGGNVPLFT